MKNQSRLFDDFSTVFSLKRLSAYLHRPECKNELDALAAYCWNIQLSQSLYPALQTLEITLRNALHQAISQDCKTEYWFNEPFLHPKEQDTINRIKITLTQKNKSIEADQIIAELHLGFWTSLFDVRYEHQQRLWPRLFASVFLFIPKKFRTRHYLSKQLNCIRNLRNRIFHFEPIWYWHNLSEQHQSLLNLLQWLSPLAYEHLIMLDHFTDAYKKGLGEYSAMLIEKIK